MVNFCAWSSEWANCLRRKTKPEPSDRARWNLRRVFQRVTGAHRGQHYSRSARLQLSAPESRAISGEETNPNLDVLSRRFYSRGRWNPNWAAAIWKGAFAIS